ncbi:MAG TPA: PKD domain-containing protein [Thermoplasmata archaeon]|nr:PKD domain-containing protein [Thermoplasmata archaeon]
MVPETDPSTVVRQGALTCPRCGAPLPLAEEDGFVTCGYCGVRTKVSKIIPPQRIPSPAEEAAYLPEPPLTSTEDDSLWGDRVNIVRAVIAIVVIVAVIAVAVLASSPPQTNPAGASVAHCSVTINASATSGPAPFTATFAAQVTAPPGVTTNEPMWQFGPFGPGIDVNFTYGVTVTHTWNTNGTYGVHVTVPDSTGQGCWTTMSVDVT